MHRNLCTIESGYRTCESDAQTVLIRQVPSGAIFVPSSPSHSNMSESSSSEVSTYEPKPTLSYAANVGLQAGVIGAFVSAIQNALGTHSYGAAGIVTRTGGTIGFFGTFL